jgi:hypothetical protein
MNKFFPFVRILHLYFGLFLSPFILIYGISAITFNHPDWINRISPVKQLPQIKTRLDKIPFQTTDLETALALNQLLDIKGEIDYVNKGENYFSYPVNKPGITTRVKINLLNDSVWIDREKQGFLRSLSYLHKMPGPHNEKIRGNSIFIKIWKALSNSIVYMLLFLSISGVYLWYFLKVERNMGLFSLALGLLCFTGLLILLS